MYIKILDSILNMRTAHFINRQYDEETNKFTIHISFPGGGFCNNHFDNREEADRLFDEIMAILKTKVIS